jgi:hypothetical protein
MATERVLPIDDKQDSKACMTEDFGSACPQVYDFIEL